jgi:hypothetical protein
VAGLHESLGEKKEQSIHVDPDGEVFVDFGYPAKS